MAQGSDDAREEKEEGTARIRSVALTGLFVLAVLYTLQVASAILLPIVLAVLLGVIIRPLILVLQHRLRIAPWIGAAIVLAGLLAFFTVGVLWIAGPASRWIERLPETLSHIEWELRALQHPVQEVREAAQRVEEIVGEAGEESVTVTENSFTGMVVRQTRGFLAAAVLTFVLLYFLLASGDMFLRKLVHVLPHFRDKVRAVEIVSRIQQDISRYVLTITLINIGVGVATGFALWLLGMPSPAVWGVMAAVFNYVPYLGAIVGLLVITLVALVSFDSLGPALVVIGVYYGITAIEGNFITPAVVGRRLLLNPVVIFIGLIFWGWIWGIPGALLAVPLLVGFKIVCERVEGLNPVSEFMGR